MSLFNLHKGVLSPLTLIQINCALTKINKDSTPRNIDILEEKEKEKKRSVSRSRSIRLRCENTQTIKLVSQGIQLDLGNDL